MTVVKHSKPGRRKRRIALFVAIALGLWITTRDGDRAALPRDPDALTCVAPKDLVDRVGRFEWTFRLPPGGSFELRLYDESYTLLGAVPDLQETFYELEPAVAEQLPTRFTWEIFARDSAGADLASCRSEVVQR